MTSPKMISTDVFQNVIPFLSEKDINVVAQVSRDAPVYHTKRNTRPLG